MNVRHGSAEDRAFSFLPTRAVRDDCSQLVDAFVDIATSAAFYFFLQKSMVEPVSIPIAFDFVLVKKTPT